MAQPGGTKGRTSTILTNGRKNAIVDSGLPADAGRLPNPHSVERRASVLSADESFSLAVRTAGTPTEYFTRF
jgi:hypothetical protein